MIQFRRSPAGQLPSGVRPLPYLQRNRDSIRLGTSRPAIYNLGQMFSFFFSFQIPICISNRIPQSHPYFYHDSIKFFLPPLNPTLLFDMLSDLVLKFPFNEAYSFPVCPEFKNTFSYFFFLGNSSFTLYWKPLTSFPSLV